MPNPTPELGLQKAIDSDDSADYLDTSLANSLNTLDSLFNNVTGHTHGGVHQGGPINAIPVSAIPDGSITSAKIQDLTIQTVDLADGSVTTSKLAAGAVTTAAIAGGVTLSSPTLNSPTLNAASIPSPTISNPTISGTIAGSPTFNAGPTTTDWFRCNTLGQGLFNQATNAGIAFDAGGPFVYNAYSGGHLITEAATQTLSNKTLTSPTINNPAINSPAIGSPTINGTATHTGAISFNSNAAACQIVWPGAESLYAGEPSGFSGTVMINIHARVTFDLNVGHNVVCQTLIQQSDPRLKSGMTVFSDDTCMTRIRDTSVQVYSYQLAPPTPAPPPPPITTTPTDIGFDATQVYAASPEFAALDSGSNPVGVNYANMSALLWGALRQLDARCTAKGI